MKDERERQEESSIIYGRNPVSELLKSGKRTINKLLISQTARGSAISEILKIAKEKGIAIHTVPPDKFDKISENSQGIAAEVSPIQYIEIDDLIKESKKNPKPL
ncbi:MAG: 23S rRNA (guanosine(2251)-2'-O)-methyltransferase RlmB, partial [Elusimicrobiota bacterium]|nr:23S rRNA (guanosine(2251)-2'-O)-methyltransferase RlmB [Elusimicrobiota bacterium]